MDETNDINDNIEEVYQLFGQIKEFMRRESEENQYLKQKLGFNEDNKDWTEQLIQQLRQQISEYQKVIDCQQNSLIEMKQIEEENKRLNENLNSLNLMLKTTEETNREWIEKIKSENNINLKDREKEITDLKLTIGYKDIDLSQLNRELIDNKSKYEDNISEIKKFYENKIKTLYKEFDDKYMDLNKKNEEKIIEIRCSCMRSVEKIKEQLETQLIRANNELKDLKEKNSHLRLQLEATKMDPKFDPKSATKSCSKTKPSEPKQKVSIRLLDLEDEEQNNGSNNGPKTVSNNGSKRKKLIPNNDSYLDFVNDN